MVQILPTSNPRFSSAWDKEHKIRNMKDGATADEASRAKSKEENDPLELMCIHDRYAC
jgi:hypothetical protein